MWSGVSGRGGQAGLKCVIGIGIGIGDEEVEVVKEVPGNTVARTRCFAGAVGEVKCWEQRLSD